MRIGFTYDLKDQYLAEGFDPVDLAEFDKPETIDGIEHALQRLGHEVERIGKLDRLMARLTAGERWDLVFNIAEGLRGPTRESQIPALLEAYDIPVTFGDSLCLAICLHKGHCKRIVRSHRIPTARFAVVEGSEFDFLGLNLVYPLFVKPVAEGTGKGVTPRSKVLDPDSLRGACLDLLERFRQPVLVEEFLPGREFTVGIVGTGEEAKVLGVMEVLLRDGAEPEVYSYENKDKYEGRVDYVLAEYAPEIREAAAIALDAYRILGCRDAGRVDIRCDAIGAPQFMEINPLAGLNPQHSDLPILCRLLGIGFEQLVADIVTSALRRVKK